MINCPLCLSPAADYSRDKFRNFYQCLSCELIFVDRFQLITPEAEKDRYDAHQNDHDDDYQKYLGKITSAILPFLPKGARGLDFGCGRTTILAGQLSEATFHTDSFDLYFLNDESIWEKKFDFVILSEVIEHLRSPREEMERLGKLLNPQGLMFIKTKFFPQTKEAFDLWFYKRDITHVQFFNQPSMEYLQRLLGMGEFKLIDEDLSLLRLH